MSPQRIQRRRTKGWRMPEGAVYVGRPSKWGSEFPVGQACDLSVGGTPSRFTVHDPSQSVALFRSWQADGLRHDAIRELAGRDLVCWCPLEDADGNRVPCHADVLLEIANSETRGVKA